MRPRIKKEKLTNADLVRANIPERYWDVRFDAIPDTAPYKGQVARYLRDVEDNVENGRGLFVTHPKNGTGKTGIACLIGKRALLQGFTVYYTMSEAYKKAVVKNQMFDEYELVEDRARSVDLLILDDFGKEFKGDSGWIESELENLFRERAQAKKTTIATGNNTPSQIVAQFGKDLSSVLKESAYVLVVPGAEDGGRDWRDENMLGTLKDISEDW